METGNSRKLLLERVKDIDVVQLYVPSFEELSRQDRILAYYLYRAALAGRKIAIDQSNRFAFPAMRSLEAICHAQDTPPELRTQILGALKQMWLHNGLHHARTHRKLSFNLARREIYTAALFAGVRLDCEVADTILNSELYPSNCSKQAADIIAESHNNFYSGVTHDEVDAWAKENERYPLNSRLVKKDGALTEEVYRAGDSRVSMGLYGLELERVNYWLRQAECYASGDQGRALEHLVGFFKSGDLKEFKKFNEIWVSYLTPVDFVIGFIESYLDARGVKGRYEGLVHCVDAEATRVMEKLGAEAAYFEGQMPWSDKYKNANAKPLPYRIVNTIFSCGDAGPFSMIGLNLPNDDEVRVRCGSKSVMLANIVSSYREVTGDKLLCEFAWDEKEVRLHEKWGERALNLHVAMHEVLGHASGRMAKEGDPMIMLPGCYSTLEEARADLVSLWLVFHPKLKELGFVPRGDEVGMALYRQYVRNGGVIQLRTAGGSEALENDHAKSRQLITHYLIGNSGGVSHRMWGGKTYIVVEDFAKMRVAVGELLAEVMRIKAEGDLSAAQALISRYGTKIDKLLRDEVVMRATALNAANYVAFVMPEPRLIYDRGRVTDAELYYPRDLADQMLRFGAE